MQLSFFEDQLLVLGTFCICAVFLERYISRHKEKPAEPPAPEARSSDDDSDSLENGASARQTTRKTDQSGPSAALTRQYLIVYAIVMGMLEVCMVMLYIDDHAGADWLQGPYVYSLYREQYGFPERIVATLFVTGFLSAGIMSPLVGAWADQ